MSCNENKPKKDYNKNNKSEYILIEFQSPAESCKYEIRFKKKTPSFISLTVNDHNNNGVSVNKFEFNIKSREEFERLFTLAENSKFLKGPLRKGAWNYLVTVNGTEKVNVYDKKDSVLLTSLFDLFEENFDYKIDYNCF